MTKLSILIPCSNDTHLTSCLNSIPHQECEVIVGINNFEPQADYPGVKLVNFGESTQQKVRNQLFNLSSGKYIKYLDADDMLHANSLKELNLINNSDYDLVISHQLPIHENITPYVSPYQAKSIFQNKQIKFPVHSNAMIYTRNILKHLHTKLGIIFKDTPLNHSMLLLDLLDIVKAKVLVTQDIVSFYRKDWHQDQASKKRVEERKKIADILFSTQMDEYYGQITYN